MLQYSNRRQSREGSQLRAHNSSTRYKGDPIQDRFFDFLLNLSIPISQPRSGKRVYSSGNAPATFSSVASFESFFEQLFYEEKTAEIGRELETISKEASAMVMLKVQKPKNHRRQKQKWTFFDVQEINQGGFSNRFRAGELVYCEYMPQRRVQASFELPKLGVVKGCQENGFRIQMKHVAEAQDASAPIQCRIYNLCKTSTSLREFRAIHSLEESPLCSQLLNPRDGLISRSASRLPKGFVKQLRKRYNQSQLQAIFNVSSTDSGINLITGPPGTGKTTTICGIIAACLRTQPGKILVCAPSNAATEVNARRALQSDLLNGKLGTKYSFLKLGGITGDNYNDRKRGKASKEKQIDEELSKISLDGLVEEEIKNLGFGLSYDEETANLNRKISRNHKKIPWIQKLKPKSTALWVHSQISRGIGDLSKNLAGELASFLPVEYDQAQLTQMIRDIQRKNEQLRLQISERDKAKKKAQNYAKRNVMDRTQVIFATLSTSGSQILQEHGIEAPVVISDEACQSSEHTSLIPLQYECKKLILVGDPMQLPPTTFSDAEGISRSLFERLQESKVKNYMLTEQYRMHPHIREFPSAEFYKGKLVDAKEVQTRPTPPGIPDDPIKFYDLVGSKEKKDKNETSKYNREEAEFIALIYQLYEWYRYKDTSIGIITPYRRQVNELKRVFQNRFEQAYKQNVQISTVDSFQGGEKDIIIFSCVSTNGTGFLSNRRRLNVAITRAKHALWIVGNARSIMRKEKLWRKMWSRFNKKGAIKVIPAAT